MKAEEKEKIDKMEKLIEELERNPTTIKFREEEAAKTLIRRQEAAAKLEALRAKQAEIIPKLREAVKDREVAYLKLKTALDAAGGELQNARAELSSENNNFDTDIRNQETLLIESADSALDEAITFFREKLSFLRSPGRISSNMVKGERNLITDTVTLTAESNVDAVNSAVRYCMAAIKELEKIKLTPELDLQKIEAIKAAIPEIDIYTESTGEKPLPGSKGINPLHLLPSDSEMDWKLGKLAEKFKKVMGK